MANDIKVIYRGNKSPSGKNNNTEYMISSERLKQLEASKMFDIEIIDDYINDFKGNFLTEYTLI